MRTKLLEFLSFPYPVSACSFFVFVNSSLKEVFALDAFFSESLIPWSSFSLNDMESFKPSNFF